MTENTFQFGDRVFHKQRPEWGAGSVVKVEEAIINGEPAHRLSIRFPNAGLKCLIATKEPHAGGAELERVEPSTLPAADLNGDATALPGFARSRLQEWEQLNHSEWLSPLAQRKIREVMTTLPEECTDAFIPLQKRLSNTARLYRFDKSGRGLIDWAVAQSGLNDPLTRFTRQELEQLFDRWATVRDSHLSKLLDASREEKAMVREALRGAPPAALAQVRKFLEMAR